MRRSIALVVLALLGVPAGAPAATLGEQRVLMMLTTWGPEPYAPATIRAELDEAAAYIRSVSFGKTWIAGEVTPWLHALASKPGCDTAASRRPPGRRNGADACSSAGGGAWSGGAGSSHTRSSSTAGAQAAYPPSGPWRASPLRPTTASPSGSAADAIAFGSSRSTGPAIAVAQSAGAFVPNPFQGCRKVGRVPT